MPKLITFLNNDFRAGDESSRITFEPTKKLEGLTAYGSQLWLYKRTNDNVTSYSNSSLNTRHKWCITDNNGKKIGGYHTTRKSAIETAKLVNTY